VDPLDVDDPLEPTTPDGAEPPLVPLVEGEPLDEPEAIDPLDASVPLEAEPLVIGPLLASSAPIVASDGVEASLDMFPPPWIETLAQ